MAQNLLQNRISAPKPKKYDFEAFGKGILKGKWKESKTRTISKNSLPQTLSQLNCKFDLWKRSFRARLPSKTESESYEKNRARPPSEIESWRSEKKAFVRDIPQKVKVEDVKTKLSYETSLQKWKLKMWKQSFHARLSSKSGSWISLLCDFFAVWRLCSGTSVLCGVFAVWRLWSVTSLLWDFFAVWFLCCETF